MDKFAPVSVVIPCFRCASTIKNAVASVFAQSLIPAELILVDDCSDDATPVVLRELETSYQGRLKIVYMQINSGAGSARNAGWAVASQPYIAFLDADDTWHPEKLRIQHQYMHDNPDVTLCAHKCKQPHGKKVVHIPFGIMSTILVSPNSLLFKNAFSTPAVMLKRDIPFRFQEGKRFAEDLLMWQTIAFSGLVVIRLEIYLASLHKSPYGVGGLSANLWQMERGELNNFVVLHREEHIGLFIYSIAALFSLTKFVKRILVTIFYKLAILTIKV